VKIEVVLPNGERSPGLMASSSVFDADHRKHRAEDLLCAMVMSG
jgi:hypothetical protein